MKPYHHCPLREPITGSLASALSHFFNEVNELISKGKISWWRGWRYEVLSIMIVRLNSATADYAPACGVKFISHDRWDMGKSLSYYSAEPMSRQEIQLTWVTQKRTLNVFMNLYWTFPLHTLSIPDELHLLLRVTSKLPQDMIDERFSKDFNWGVNQRKDISQGLLKKLMNWDLSPYGTKRMQMAQRNSPLFWDSGGLPSKLHEIPCSLRHWLPMQEGI